MRKKNLTPQYFTDQTGRHLVRLPLSNAECEAVAEAAMFDNLRAREGRIEAPFLNHADGRNSYPTVYLPNSREQVTLGRALLNPPKGYRVTYRNHSPLLVTGENLALRAPWADEETSNTVMGMLLAEARGAEVKTHA